MWAEWLRSAERFDSSICAWVSVAGNVLFLACDRDLSFLPSSIVVEVALCCLRVCQVSTRASIFPSFLVVFSDLKSARRNCCLINLNGDLLAVGGNDGMQQVQQGAALVPLRPRSRTHTHTHTHTRRKRRCGRVLNALCLVCSVLVGIAQWSALEWTRRIATVHGGRWICTFLRLFLISLVPPLEPAVWCRY